MSHRLTKSELAASLRAAGRTPEEIADVLETTVAYVLAWTESTAPTVDMMRIRKAVPDLLAACEAAEAHFGRPDYAVLTRAAQRKRDLNVLALLRSAIAKARGTQP